MHHPHYTLESYPQAPQAGSPPPPNLANCAYPWNAATHEIAKGRRPGVNCGLDGTSRDALLILDVDQIRTRKQALAMFRDLKKAVLAEAETMLPKPKEA